MRAKTASPTEKQERCLSSPACFQTLRASGLVSTQMETLVCPDPALGNSHISSCPLEVHRPAPYFLHSEKFPDQIRLRFLPSSWHGLQFSVSAKVVTWAQNLLKQLGAQQSTGPPLWVMPQKHTGDP